MLRTWGTQIRSNHPAVRKIDISRSPEDEDEKLLKPFSACAASGVYP